MVFMGSTPDTGGNLGEAGDDLEISVALERHDQVGELFELFPAPFVELGRVGAAAGLEDVDLTVGAGEAEGEPALALAAILSLQRNTEGFVGQVVIDPVVDFGDELDRADRGLLEQLAIGGVELVPASALMRSPDA